MESVQNLVPFFLDLGASVLLPIVIFILASAFGAKPGHAVRSVLMVGLILLSEAVREFLQKRAGGREIYIGLDSAAAIGRPAFIAASLVKNTNAWQRAAGYSEGE